jgi:hypothetical protein
LPLTQGEYEFTLEGTENLKGKVVFTK